MDIDIRPCTKKELPAFMRTLEGAFGHDISDENIERHVNVMDPERMHGAFDGDALVGTAGVYPFTFTIPGGHIPAAGVTMVGVLPSHRRRGILTRMMRIQIDDARKRGEPVAVLWASEDAIYQRFGYGMASLQGQIDADRERAAFIRDAGPVGRTRLIDVDEAVKIFPSVYDRVCETTPGMFARSPEWWRYHRFRDSEDSRRGGGPMWRAVLEIDGEPQAYAVYRVFSNWEGGLNTGHTHVEEAMGVSAVATREIWRFLFGVDLMQKVRGWLLPPDHPLMLSMVEPTRLRFSSVDTFWLRLVDLKDALEARGYQDDGSVTFEIADSFCDWNAGTWRLRVENGRAAVEQATGDAELVMDVSDLAPAYLGAFSFTQLSRAGRIQEARAGAAARADAMFRTPFAPWCPEIF
jgi:predicted acetyltransferase